MDELSVEPHGIQWAIKHNGAFLGFTATGDEAERLATYLVSSLQAEGRHATLLDRAISRRTAVDPPNEDGRRPGL